MRGFIFAGADESVKSRKLTFGESFPLYVSPTEYPCDIYYYTARDTIYTNNRKYA